MAFKQLSDDQLATWFGKVEPKFKGAFRLETTQVLGEAELVDEYEWKVTTTETKVASGGPTPDFCGWISKNIFKCSTTYYTSKQTLVITYTFEKVPTGKKVKAPLAPWWGGYRVRVGTQNQPSFMLDEGFAPVVAHTFTLGPESKRFLRTLHALAPQEGGDSPDAEELAEIALELAEFDMTDEALTRAEMRRVYVRRLAIAAWLDLQVSWRVADLAPADFLLLLEFSVRGWFDFGVGQPADQVDPMPPGAASGVDYDSMQTVALLNLFFPAYFTPPPNAPVPVVAALNLVTQSLPTVETGLRNSSQTVYCSVARATDASGQGTGDAIQLLTDSAGRNFANSDAMLWHFGNLWDANPLTTLASALHALSHYTTDEKVPDDQRTAEHAMEAVFRYVLQMPMRYSQKTGIAVSVAELGFGSKSATPRTTSAGTQRVGYPPYNTLAGNTPSVLDFESQRFGYGPEAAQYAKILLRSLNIPSRTFRARVPVHNVAWTHDAFLSGSIAWKKIHNLTEVPDRFRSVIGWTPNASLFFDRVTMLALPLDQSVVIGEVLTGFWTQSAYARNELSLATRTLDTIMVAAPFPRDFGQVAYQTFLLSEQGQRHAIDPTRQAILGYTQTAKTRLPYRFALMKPYYEQWAKEHRLLVEKWEKDKTSANELAVRRSRRKIFSPEFKQAQDGAAVTFALSSEAGLAATPAGFWPVVLAAYGYSTWPAGPLIPESPPKEGEPPQDKSTYVQVLDVTSNVAWMDEESDVATAIDNFAVSLA